MGKPQQRRLEVTKELMANLLKKRKAVEDTAEEWPPPGRITRLLEAGAESCEEVLSGEAPPSAEELLE